MTVSRAAVMEMCRADMYDVKTEIYILQHAESDHQSNSINSPLTANYLYIIQYICTFLNTQHD